MYFTYSTQLTASIVDNLSSFCETTLRGNAELFGYDNLKVQLILFYQIIDIHTIF